MTRVRDLFDIPERVEKGRFQVTLTEGVARPEETVSEYVVTPRLADAFDQALGKIDTAIADQRSVGTYLHGSFGSGKSHFMAMLSLLLADEEVAWQRKEFDHLRARYGWVGKAKILELHMHMLGKDSLEEAIYPAYLEHLAAHHPQGQLPALFADEDLFENAAELLDELGDQRFFAKLNALDASEAAGASGVSSATSASDWSFMGEEATAVAGGKWDRARFEAATSSQELDTRQALLDALLRTHFKAFRGSVSSYRELEQGLAVMAEHAKGLGYAAIVLFLDELILRLSYGAAEPKWLSRMVQSMVKLVERNTGVLAIPVVSFIARQRLLNEMVGERLAGPETALLNEQLDHSRGRFGTITLPNEELPEIISQRVLKPADDDAREQIDAAFAKLQRSTQSGRNASWDTLTAARYDAGQFRKLYPFSPALVEALINLSGSLQRQRTAIKLLSELLVEHIEDLELGQLVGVGDLYDLLAVGDDSADGVMRELFARAKLLYRRKLLPVIQEDNETNTAERCQRLRDNHPMRLGCSGCSEKRCRRHNRLAKTMIVAALAPEGVLKDLTVQRLLELNHGVFKSRLPGQEAKGAIATIRKWTNSIEEIHIGEGQNPEISLELQGVELKPIMAKAANEDRPARRVAELRRLLFDAMQIADDGSSEIAVEQLVEWRKTRRQGQVRFGNVRLMGAEQLRCPTEHDWRLIIDFPFDERDHGPAEDEAVLRRYVEDQREGTWTLVWLPSFFSSGVNNLLGELVILNHILDGGDKQRQTYIQHLSMEQQEMALNLMRSQQNHKRNQIRTAMRKAYGLEAAGASDDHLDSSRRIERNLHLLVNGIEIGRTLASDLGHALEKYIHALLDERYPQHPRLSRSLTPKTIERVLGHYDRMLEQDGGRLELDKHTLEELRGTLGELGLVTTTETAMRPRDDALQDFDKRCAALGKDQEPTAELVGMWFDPEGKRGLQPPAVGLVVRALARASKRTLLEADARRPFNFQPGKPIPGAVLLRKPKLPSRVNWERALATAGAAFGIALPGSYLHADSLARFASELEKVLERQHEAALALPGALRHWYDALGMKGEEQRRLLTAISARELVMALQGQPEIEQVRALAAFEAQTSISAVSRSLATGASSLRVLDSELTLGVLRQLHQHDSPKARDLDEQVRKLLRQNELESSLSELMPQFAIEAQRVVTSTGSVSVRPPPAKGNTTPQPGWKPVVEDALALSGRAEILAKLEALLAEVRGQDEGAKLRLRGHILVEREDG